MTQLYLIRHGLPTTGDDPGLDPVGKEQAQRLADWLAVDHFDALISSPMRRAVETAEPLAAATGLAIELDAGLQEWNIDVAPEAYIPPDQLPADDPRMIAMLEGRFEDYAPELDLPKFQRRVVAAMEPIYDRYPGGRVLVVCHGGVILAYTAAILGIPRVFWTNPHYTTVARVNRMANGRTNLMSFGEDGHLLGTRSAAVDVTG